MDQKITLSEVQAEQLSELIENPKQPNTALVEAQRRNAPNTNLKPIAMGVIASTAGADAALTQASELDEVTAKYQEWQEATYLLIGVMLKQLGRRAIEVKPNEIVKFAKANSVSFQRTAEGNLRYTIEKKK